MSQQSVTLELPDELYERIRQAADASHRPVSDVLVETLTYFFGDMPFDNPVTDDALRHLTDAQLWALVYRQFPVMQDIRLRDLSALGKSGQLSENEQRQLEQLVSSYDQYVLLRSRVLVELHLRGHDVQARLAQNLP